MVVQHKNESTSKEVLFVFGTTCSARERDAHCGNAAHHSLQMLEIMVYLMSDFCQVILANFLRRVNFANSPYLNLKTTQNYGILLIVMINAIA